MYLYVQIYPETSNVQVDVIECHRPIQNKIDYTNTG